MSTNPPVVTFRIGQHRDRLLRHRRWHRFRAWLGGYFWKPCPRCGTKFGGHEWGRWNYASIPSEKPGVQKGICLACVLETREEYALTLGVKKVPG